MAGVWVRAGSIAVTNGSTLVTGTGTDWKNPTTGPQKGHTLIIPNGSSIDLYEIDVVTSATQLQLVSAYRGSTGSGKAYAIDITRTDSIPEFARRLAATLSYHQSNLDVLQQLYTSDADSITITAPDGTQHNLIPWKKITGDGETQLTLATAQADRAEQEANRAEAEADSLAALVQQTTLDNLARENPARHPFRGKLPSLALEFARNRYHLVGDYGLEPKQLTDVLTVSNGASTRVDHRGVIVPTAVGQPVIDYDPETGECLGLSLNEERKNSIINSGNLLGAGWGGTCTVTTDGTLSPDGKQLAYKVEDTSNSETHYWNQPVAITSSGSTRTASIYVKKGNSRYINVETQHYSGGSTVNRNGYIDLDTGLVSAGTATDMKVKRYPNGWYRVSLSSTDSNSGNSFVRLLFRPVAQATSLDVTLTGYTYFWGGQIEFGKDVSRYTPTEDSEVNRVSDYIKAVLSNVLSSGRGTLFIHARNVRPRASSDFGRIFQLSAGMTNANAIYAIRRTSSGYSLYIMKDGVQQNPFINKNFGDDVKIVISWEDGGMYYIVVNGSLEGSGSNLSAPLNMDTLLFGDAGAPSLNCENTTFLYYPEPMTQEEAEELAS